MTLPELDDFVKQSPSLSIVGVDEKLEKLWIRGTGIDPETQITGPMVYEVALADLPNATRTQLELNLHGKSIVYHLSRIIGYFSITDSWNKSKIAELKDRGKGDYGVH